MQASEAVVDGFLDHGEVSLPSGVRVTITLQFLLDDEKEWPEIVWVDWVIDEGRVVSHD